MMDAWILHRQLARCFEKSVTATFGLKCLFAVDPPQPRKYKVSKGLVPLELQIFGGFGGVLTHTLHS